MAVKPVSASIQKPKMIDVGIQNPNKIGVDFGRKVTLTYNKDYEQLDNLPSIEGVPLIGNKTFPQLNMASLTNSEIEALLTL